MCVTLASQNIYEYKKIVQFDLKEVEKEALNSGNFDGYIQKKLIDKINELVVEYNHLAKDFELYKKAHKDNVMDFRAHYHNEITGTVEITPINPTMPPVDSSPWIFDFNDNLELNP